MKEPLCSKNLSTFSNFWANPSQVYQVENSQNNEIKSEVLFVIREKLYTNVQDSIGNVTLKIVHDFSQYNIQKIVQELLITSENLVFTFKKVGANFKFTKQFQIPENIVDLFLLDFTYILVTEQHVFLYGPCPNPHLCSPQYDPMKFNKIELPSSIKKVRKASLQKNQIFVEDQSGQWWVVGDELNCVAQRSSNSFQRFLKPNLILNTQAVQQNSSRFTSVQTVYIQNNMLYSCLEDTVTPLQHLPNLLINSFVLNKSLFISTENGTYAQNHLLNENCVFQPQKTELQKLNGQKFQKVVFDGQTAVFFGQKEEISGMSVGGVVGIALGGTLAMILVVFAAQIAAKVQKKKIEQRDEGEKESLVRGGYT